MQPPPRSRGLRLAAVALLSLAGTLAASPAHAEDPAFVYTTGRAPRDYVRTVVEELGILGLGLLQYSSVKSNEADWDVGVDWPGVRSKLLWSASSFDDNRFDTNWLTHPAAGFLYYSTARGNRLDVLPSFAATVLASTVWEELGELREQVALNDIVVTPVSALPLGESALQLGAFLHRGRRTPALVALGWLFAPWKSAHDLVDGLTPQGAYVVDELGLPADVWHRFTAGGSAGVTAQQGGARSLDGSGHFETELVTLPGYRRDGKRSVLFGAGEVTSTRFQMAASRGELVDLAFEARTVPTGWYRQEVDAGAAGGLYGSETLLGLEIAAEYTTHDYDRDRRRPSDRIALVSAGGSMEEIVHVGPLTLRGRVRVLGDFAGVGAYALSEYQRVSGEAGLTSVLRKERYYHGYGATLWPQLDVAVGAFDAGAQLRFDAFQAIEHVDVDGPLDGEVPASDRRTSARAFAGVSPWRHLRLYVAGERNERSGSVAEVHAARSELSARVGAELVF